MEIPMTETMARKGKTASIPVAENIINNQTRTFTDTPASTRQGDLYFVAISGLPASARPRDDRQLADGNTQGSRHMCKTGSVYNADKDEVAALIHEAMGVEIDTKYIGPVFKGPAYVEHPEHGDHDFQCDSVFAVVVQRSMDADEREQRVQD